MAFQRRRRRARAAAQAPELPLHQVGAQVGRAQARRTQATARVWEGMQVRAHAGLPAQGWLHAAQREVKCSGSPRQLAPPALKLAAGAAPQANYSLHLNPPRLPDLLEKEGFLVIQPDGCAGAGAAAAAVAAATSAVAPSCCCCW